MHLRRLGALIAIALTVITLHTGSVAALAVPPAPTDVPIVDQTNTLTPEQKTSLAKTINDERASTGNQIAILMIPSLQGESLEDYSLNVARTWGVGQKDRNSGVLLFIAKDDHKLRIEVGYGLEGALPDARASQIIRNRITPAFKKGDFYGGISSGVNGIITAIHGEADPNLNSSSATNTKSGFTNWIEPVLFGLFFIPGWLAAILARSKSWWAGGVVGGVAGTLIGVFAGFLFVGIIAIIGLILLGLLFDYFVSRNYRAARKSGRSPSWWAGGGGGFSGGSSGSHSSFGGGSFGGGGSSGSW